MASDSTPISLSAATLVQGSQAPTAAPSGPNSGKNLPPGGTVPNDPRFTIAANTVNKSNPIAAASQGRDGSAQAPQWTGASVSSTVTEPKSTDAAAAKTAGTEQQASGHAEVSNLVAQLNKVLNDSGRPDQFRVDPQSSATIQEVNPANGEVVGQFAASEFPALARSVGASGLLFDDRA
jgi:hypothetical protein